jgi:hypothetical protein
MDIDSMTDQQVADYAAWASLHGRMLTAAQTLARREADDPGVLAAVVSLLEDRADDIVWRESGITGSIEVSNGAWFLVATPTNPPGADPVRVKICTDSGAPAVATNGHCPITLLCDKCQWEVLTPDERQHRDEVDAGRRASHRRSGGSPAAAQAVGEPMAEWERELVAGGTL